MASFRFLFKLCSPGSKQLHKESFPQLTLCLIVIYDYSFLFLAPLKVFGNRRYILSDVMEIDGPAKYLKAAEETGICLNQETEESCLAKEYLAKGLEQCSCTPYKLRNHTKKVKIHIPLGSFFHRF